MAVFANAMEIFVLLDRSNCRRCGEKTCLAFAGAVYRGHRTLEHCPKIETASLQLADLKGAQTSNENEDPARDLSALREKVRDLDLSEAAGRTGGNFSEGHLSVKILGKQFSIDGSGTFSSAIHIIPWVTVPFLVYVLQSQALPQAGEWISFREIKEGTERYPLFRKRCEEAMRRVADTWPDLFNDIVHLFDGRQVDAQFTSDISVVLNLLPRVPLMICYWQAGEGIDSSLNVFFDRSVDAHLDVGAVYMLATGLTQMFEKLALLHGYPIPPG